MCLKTFLLAHATYKEAHEVQSIVNVYDGLDYKVQDGSGLEMFEKFIETQSTKPIKGCKHTGLSEHVIKLTQIYVTAKFIVMNRDIKDSYCSMKEKHQITVKEIKEKHLRTYSQIHILEQAFPELIHNVQYEELVKEPEETLSKICEFLGEKYNEGMLDFYQQEQVLGNLQKGMHENLSVPIFSTSVGRHIWQLTNAEEVEFNG